MKEGSLVISTNSGRYAISDPEGQDLTSGQPIEIYIGGRWITGAIEHGGALYTVEGMKAQRGYFFIDADGEITGLCKGMRVRVP